MGYVEGATFFHERLVDGKDSISSSTECHFVPDAWKKARVSIDRIDLKHGEQLEAIESFRTELCQRWRHRAVILADIVTNHEVIVEQLGPALKSYVADGGRLALLGCEGVLMGPILQLFDLPWRSDAYYRTTWGTRESNHRMLNEVYFPATIGTLHKDTPPSKKRFSAKSCSLQGVREEHRCYGVTKDSEHESLSMLLQGHLSAAPMDSSSVMFPEEGPSEESDVSVAVCQYGKGFIAYFGDVNCEVPTIEQCMSFCIGPGVLASTQDILLLSEKASKMKTRRANGGKCFSDGKLDEALNLYEAALSEVPPPWHGMILHEAVLLISNKAECHLRLGNNVAAVAEATRALELDPAHVKSRFRRARACINVGSETCLQKAKHDIASLETLENSKQIVAMLKGELAKAGA